MRKRAALLLIAVSAMTRAALPATPETGFLNRKVALEGVEYRYVVYVPAGWDAERAWPVVLFLHGAGERGSDGLLQSDVGLPSAIRSHADRFPAVVVMPQCPNGIWWTAAAMQKLAVATLDAAIREFHGDATRVYLTGLSMGGYGTWAIAANNPGRFAALAPVCGGVRRPALLGPDDNASRAADPYAETALKVGRTPVWIFHGAADPTVPVSESRRMAKALKAAGNLARYTEYQGVGHNSWDKAYNEPDFASWLFAQRLGK